MKTDGWSAAVLEHLKNRKSHYFRDGNALCGALIREPGELEPNRPPTVDDCRRCRRKLRLLANLARIAPPPHG